MGATAGRFTLDEARLPILRDKGGSQMFAYDFDGDGDQDVITAINAHGYGLAWFEQIPAAAGGIDFRKHLIMGATAEESPAGIAFSQLHGMDLADMDGDGIKDLVTGKRYFAHGGEGSRWHGSAGALLVSDDEERRWRRNVCPSPNPPRFGSWCRYHCRRYRR